MCICWLSFFSSKWTPEDDKQLLEVVRIVGLGNWRRGNVIGGDVMWLSAFWGVSASFMTLFSFFLSLLRFPDRRAILSIIDWAKRENGLGQKDKESLRQPRSQGLSSSLPWSGRKEGKKRDPGNEVVSSAFLVSQLGTNPSQICRQKEALRLLALFLRLPLPRQKPFGCYLLDPVSILIDKTKSY